jgi:2,3,4,5-tetrahydropyridine-2,6-dicarboxylate N-succinyltransferase
MSFDPSLRATIEATYEDRSRMSTPESCAAIEKTIAHLDRGELRVAERRPEGEWVTHAWIKQAILLYFALRGMNKISVGPYEFHDKIPLKKDLDAAGVRVVPGAIVRYGAFLEKGAIVMPGFVNIGAYVGSGTMVDTWATVGSCAQVGRDCHLAGGVGIGGVIVEGLLVEREAVIGAGVVLTASTTILDVSGPSVVESKGRIPARSVVIPGVRQKKFPAGEFAIPCALIIGKRSEATDRKVSLNDALRDFAVPV